MKTGFKIALGALVFLALAAFFGIYITTHDIAVLSPKGMIGTKERDLIVTSSLLMLIVVIPVFILTMIFAWKYRGNGKGKHTPDWEHNYIAEYCWWGVPLLIIFVLSILCWKSTHELNPFRPIQSDKKSLTIQVVALQWKWLFIYPEQGIATVNFLQFPEKTPISFEISADAPMNSFWIPQLGGQIYAMPGMRSKLHLIADKPGKYRGASSNISGEGFAGMYFPAVSSTQADFTQWVQEVKQSGTALTFEKYEELVKPSSYVPSTNFVLTDSNLFDQILEKYEAPRSVEKRS
jgi:cytochrome o ubiquinol oxidase subunit 2